MKKPNPFAKPGNALPKGGKPSPMPKKGGKVMPKGKGC